MITKLATYSNREIFLFVLIVIVGALIIRAIVKSDKVQNVRYNLLGAKTEDGTNVNEISDTRKTELKELAKTLRSDIYSAWWTATSTLEKISLLNDAEFIYLYEFYIEKFGENPSCAVDWEALPETDKDEQFIARSKKLHLPQKDAGFFESC